MESLRVLDKLGPKFSRALAAGEIDVRVHRLQADEFVRSGSGDKYLIGHRYHSTTAQALRYGQFLLLVAFVVSGFVCHPILGLLSLMTAPLAYRFGMRSHTPDFTMRGWLGRAMPIRPGKWSKDYGVAVGVGAVLGMLAGDETRLAGVWMASLAVYYAAEYTRFTAAEHAARYPMEASDNGMRLLIARDVIALREYES